MPLRRTLAAIGCCAALAMGAAACGKAKLDTSRLEDQIKHTLATRTGIPIASVECPADVEAKQGHTFRCTATTTRGERVVLNVTQDDSKGGVSWRVARGPLGR
jgi:Domain of unknown function (DUF4333)